MVDNAMLDKVSVALVQMKMAEDPWVNLNHALELVSKAAMGGAHIICLPELFMSRYFPQTPRNKDSVQKYVELIPGEVSRALSRCAQNNNVVLVAGSICEHDALDGKLYNTTMFFCQEGKLLGKYRKTHIPHDSHFYEQDYFEPGNTGFKVYNTEFGNIGTLICYDQWFPEAARVNALMGAELVLYPTAIGTIQGVEQTEGDWQQGWEDVMRGHALANGMVIGAVNRCGKEGEIDFWGGSFICDAFGKTLVRGGQDEEIVCATISLEHGKNIRQGWKFLQNRRSETYQQLVNKG